MENAALAGVPKTIFIQQSELEFVMNLLGALKLRGIVDFDVDDETEFAIGFRHINARELNSIIEISEQSEKISAEEFKKKYGL